jgi:hypothetical protein
MRRRLRAIGVGCGLVLVALAFTLTLISAPRRAEADCRSSSVCTWSHGRQICSSSTVCAPPRVRSCSFVTRCAPQRDCVSRPGYASCVTRNVCRREQVCY